MEILKVPEMYFSESFSSLAALMHFLHCNSSVINFLLKVGEDAIIFAASVTYFWTTDVGAGLGVDEVGVSSDSFLPETALCCNGMGSCSGAVTVFVEGFDSMINRCVGAEGYKTHKG